MTQWEHRDCYGICNWHEYRDYRLDSARNVRPDEQFLRQPDEVGVTPADLRAVYQCMPDTLRAPIERRLGIASCPFAAFT